MSTPGDIAVLQYGSDHKWHYHFLSPTEASTLGFNTSVAAPTLPGIGSAAGQIPMIPIPLSCMDLSLSAPLAYDGTAKAIYITGVTSFATVASTGSYSDLSGKPTIPSSQVNSDWSASSGITQVLNKPTLGTASASNTTAFDASGSAASAQAASQPLDGDLTSLAAASGTNTVYYRSAANTWSPVTMGGNMSFTGGTLNVSSPGTGTVTSIVAGTGLSGGTITTTGTLAVSASQSISTLSNLTGNGFVKTSGGVGTLSVDTSTYLTGNQTITLSGDVTGSGATAITSTLKNTGTAGTYSSVTTDAQGRVTTGFALSLNNAASVAIQTVAAAGNGAQVSATQAALVSYTVPTSTTSTIGGNSSVTVVLEICATNSATAANWVTISAVQNSQSVSLAVALQVIQVLQQIVCGIVPAGYFRRLRSIITGTGSASTASGQEALI